MAFQGVLQQGATEEKGDTARLQSFVGAIAIGDLVKSTLGPKGMDKILQPMPGDGARIGKTQAPEAASFLSIFCIFLRISVIA